MTQPKPTAWAIEQAREVVLANGGIGECVCDIAYSARRKTDPRCAWCGWAKELAEDTAVALDSAYRKGVEDSAVVAENFVMSDGDYCTECAVEIRALLEDKRMTPAELAAEAQRWKTEKHVPDHFREEPGRGPLSDFELKQVKTRAEYISSRDVEPGKHFSMIILELDNALRVALRKQE